MEKFFITKIKNNNNIYEVYLVDGKYVIYLNNEICNDEYSKKILDSLNKKPIQTFSDEHEKSKKKIELLRRLAIANLYATLAATGAAQLATTLTSSGLIKSDSKLEYVTNSITEESMAENGINVLYTQYMSAIESNPNLNDSYKNMLSSRYNYVKKNSQYMNINEVLKVINELNIVEHDYLFEENPNVNGCFQIVDGVPTIDLYKNADERTAIHEIYHALHFNKYYWDETYYYEDKFIGSDEYDKLNFIEKEKCSTISVYGVLLEEAYTTDNTANDPHVYPYNLGYTNELTLYKAYEAILGKEKMDEIMLSVNPVKEFMNELLNLGLSKTEAVELVSRMDLLNAFTKELEQPTEDFSYFRYQLCNDLVKVYKAKHHNINNDTLKLTVLYFTKDCDLDWILKENYNKEFDEDFNKLIFEDKLSTKDYILDENDIKYKDDLSITDIIFDYYNYDNLVIYVYLNDFDYVSLKRNSKGKFEEYVMAYNEDDSRFTYKLYTDYNEYAMNMFNNDQAYASFFASIYANNKLDIYEKAIIKDKYDIWCTIENKERFERDILMQGTYDEIIDFIDLYEMSINKSRN